MNELLSQIENGNFDTAYTMMKESKLRFYDLMCRLLFLDKVTKLKHFTYYLINIGYLKEVKNGK